VTGNLLKPAFDALNIDFIAKNGDILYIYLYHIFQH